MITYHLAEVAELVDALASGASELWLVEVQVLFSAPFFMFVFSNILKLSPFCAQRMLLMRHPFSRALARRSWRAG